MDGDSPAAVDARAISFRVEAKALLDRVDLRAGRGQFVGLIGPNGAGKSTLLRALSGVLRQQEGTVWLEGADLRAMPARDVAAMLALVPQIAPYTQGFTAFELVLMGRYPHLGRFQVEGRGDGRIAREAMARTEDGGVRRAARSTRFPGASASACSWRGRWRSSRAYCCWTSPPRTSTSSTSSRSWGWCGSWRDGGLTAIAAIHDLNLAARYCDRLTLLSGGRALTEGPPEEVLTPETIRVRLRGAGGGLPRTGDGRARDQPHRARAGGGNGVSAAALVAIAAESGRFHARGGHSGAQPPA